MDSCLWFSFTVRLTVYIEMAANGMFGAGKDGQINTPDPDRSFTLSMLQLAVLDYQIYGIIRDLKILIDMSKVHSIFLFIQK